MEQPKGLKILEHCWVVPPAETTTAATTTTLPLTFFDLLWLRYQPSDCLFFYEFPQTTKSFFDSVLPKLKHSLSLTLQHYLPLAGNLFWPHDSPKPFIKYVNGDAVSLTVAESNEDFDCLVGNFCEILKHGPLIPHLTISREQAAALALQVTLFPNFGFCIGITTHHGIVDGNSSTLFMKSWAYICSKLGESSSFPSLPAHLTPFFDRTVIPDPTRIDEIFSKVWLDEDGPNNRSLALWDSKRKPHGESIRGTFELKSQDIQNLKKYVQSKLRKKKIHLSTFSVTSSYVLTCLVKAEQMKQNKIIYVIRLDCRSRLESEIPPTYFGDCIANKMVVLEINELLEFDGIICAIEKISEALYGLIEDGVLNGAENWIYDMRSCDGGRVVPAAGSPRFEVYGTDFGWGKPKKVDLASIGNTGAFTFWERRDGDGVEIGLVLNKDEMKAFADVFAKGLEAFC